jgi:D-alanyl-D-alanine dipeptidase
MKQLLLWVVLVTIGNLCCSSIILEKTTHPQAFDLTLYMAADSNWVDVSKMDSTIKLDLRYASTNNFVKEKMYECGHCFLRKVVAEAAVKAHKSLKSKGFGGLKMYDCYRPQSIQWRLWKKLPDDRYVADPKKGSMHNRGAALDLTLVDKMGKELDMGTPFDFFGPEAYPTYTKHSAQIQANRKVLQDAMFEQNFRIATTEWWHFSYIPMKFPISDFQWPCK